LAWCSVLMMFTTVRRPANTRPLGKALLAERFGADRDHHIPADLAPITPHTVTDRAELEEALENRAGPRLRHR
jgi:DNA-binding IclR family transcriptional regulator